MENENLDFLDHLLESKGVLESSVEMYRSSKLNWIFEVRSDACLEVLEHILIRIRESSDEELIEEILGHGEIVELSEEERSALVNVSRGLNCDNYLEYPYLKVAILWASILKRSYDKHKGQTLIDRHSALVKFFFNLYFFHMKLRLDRTEEFRHISEPVVADIFHLGFLFGLLKSTETYGRQEWQKVHHEAMSQQYQKTADGPARDKYEEACQLADKLWLEGDDLSRKDMIDYVLALDGFEALDPEKLKKRISPIASQYKKISPRGRPRTKNIE